jgi:hypothetical protein
MMLVVVVVRAVAIVGIVGMLTRAAAGAVSLRSNAARVVVRL